MRRSLSISWACGLLGCASLAGAFPVSIVVDDTPRQDPLSLPNEVHELGWGPNTVPVGPFPQDEQISSAVAETTLISCPQNYEPQGPPNWLVDITNLTNIWWTDLHFVADPDAALTNDDGLINSGLAFRIDNVGLNTPLVFESKTPDLIFEPGETWQFIVQNWFHPSGVAPHVFDSLGVGFNSAGFPPSSASIIALVPEPATLSVLFLAAAALGLRRRA